MGGSWTVPDHFALSSPKMFGHLLKVSLTKCRTGFWQMIELVSYHCPSLKFLKLSACTESRNFIQMEFLKLFDEKVSCLEHLTKCSFEIKPDDAKIENQNSWNLACLY
jgi:hypothetical protein